MVKVGQVRYNDIMDKECIPLCDAINDIPGLETSGSCCGHGKDSFKIYMPEKNIYHRNFLILMRSLCPRYGGPIDWRVTLIMSDMTKDSLHIVISSESITGEEAFKQSLQIVENIRLCLEHENFQKLFSVGKYLNS